MFEQRLWCHGYRNVGVVSHASQPHVCYCRWIIFYSFNIVLGVQSPPELSLRAQTGSSPVGLATASFACAALWLCRLCRRWSSLCRRPLPALRREWSHALVASSCGGADHALLPLRSLPLRVPSAGSSCVLLPARNPRAVGRTVHDCRNQRCWTAAWTTQDCNTHRNDRTSPRAEHAPKARIMPSAQHAQLCRERSCSSAARSLDSARFATHRPENAAHTHRHAAMQPQRPPRSTMDTVSNQPQQR